MQPGTWVHFQGPGQESGSFQTHWGRLHQINGETARVEILFSPDCVSHQETMDVPVTELKQMTVMEQSLANTILYLLTRIPRIPRIA